MAWGDNNNISTTYLDSDADSPKLARPEIKAAIDELQAVISGRNSANGVAGLNASSKISAQQLPDEINSSASTDLTLDPTTNIVVVEDIIKLTPKTTAQLNSQANLAEGMIAFCSDAGDSAGVGIPVYYTGGQWRSMIDGNTI